MPSAEVLDFERLLSPIPGENPSGISLREDYSPQSAYHALKDARAKARAAERNVVWGDEVSDLRSEWRPVLDLAPKILSEQSKDLEVTAWLIEALVRFYGYAGLRDGFRLAREFCERFWETLYPLPDEEDGMLARTAPLAGLNGEDAEGTLINPILNVPITGEGSDRRLTVCDYRQACDVDRIADPDKRAQRIAQGAVSLEIVERAVATTPAAFFRELLEDLERGTQEFMQLTRLLEEKCGREMAPPTSNIRNALETCMETVKGLARNVLAADEPADDASASNGALAKVDGAASRSPTRVNTREDAFRALLQVADFFKRTEPHSPVSYALEQAVRWGRMPLPELMTELIPDDATRSQLFKLIGIRSAERTEKTE